jgi:PAS domain S-box-containing protein
MAQDPQQQIDALTEEVAQLRRELDEERAAHTTDEEKWRTLFDGLHSTIHLVDQQLVLRYVNRTMTQWCRQLGLETVTPGTPLLEAFPFLSAEVEREYQEVFSKGEPQVNREINTLAGAPQHTETLKIPIHRGGEVRWVATVITDMATAIDAEEALRSSEKRYRAIVDSSPMGMQMYRLTDDDQLVFVGANPAADRLLGVDHQSVMGKTMEEAFGPLADTEIPQRYREVVRTGDSWKSEQVSYDDDRISGAFEVFASRSGPGQLTVIFLEITARRRAEAERSRLLAILESTSDMVAMATPAMETSYLNRAGAKLLGWGPEEVFQKKISDAHPPRVIELLQSVALPTAVKHGLWSGETALLGADDTEIPVSQLIMAHRSDAGELEYYSTVVRDLRPIRQAENTLQIQRDLGIGLGACNNLDEVLNLSLVGAISILGMDAGGVYLVDPDTGWFDLKTHRGLPADYVEAVSRIAPDSTGAQLALKGKPIFGQYHRLLRPQDDTRISAGIRAFAALPIRHQDQVIACVNLASYTRDETTPFEQQAVVTITTLIGESIGRKRAEEGLRRSEAQHRILLRALPDAVTMTDLAGNLTYATDQAARLHGFESPEQMIGMSSLDLIAPEEQEQARAGFPLTVKHESFRDREFTLTRRDGTQFPGELSAAVIRNEQGEPEAFVAISRSIERRRDAELALAQSEQQLVQAQKMETVGRLAGGVAHDFNNLLAAIQVTCELMETEIPEGTQLRKDLAQIMETSDRGANLVRQLLAFSGRKPSQTERVHLNEVVRPMHKMLRRLIGENVRLRLDLGEGLGAVEADPGQLDQVLVNLTVNAVEAMPRGGTLTVSTTRREAPSEPPPEHKVAESYLVLEVRDTGIGMDSDTRARIFEPFFSTKDDVQGTGLGLAIVYSVARQSGGFVQVDTTPGSGTSFELWLPESDPSQWPETLFTPPPRTELPGGEETILVVEDDAVLLRQIARVLSQYGYTVLQAHGGGEALRVEKRSSAPVDLLLTDLVMPDSTGIQLSEALGRTRPEIKVLLMSGHIGPNLLEQSSHASTRAFLPKPFTAEVLIKMVRQVLDE